jgi:hypothetical protein
MSLRCVAAFTGVIVLALPGIAAAQMPGLGPLPTFDNAPPAPPPGGGMVPPAGMAPPAGSRAPAQAAVPARPQAMPPGADQEPPPCIKEFLVLRQEAQKKASLIKVAQDRDPKPTREEMCQVIKTFAAAEAKVIKYVTDNQVACGIPPEAITQMKQGQAQTVKFRTAVCTGGPAGGSAAAAPPTPKLSDELGFRGIAGPSSGATGRGTFDTLTGNALER